MIIPLRFSPAPPLALMFACWLLAAPSWADEPRVRSGGEPIENVGGNDASPDPLAESKRRFADLHPDADADPDQLARFIARVKLQRPRSQADYLVLKYIIRDAAQQLLDLKQAPADARERAEAEWMEATADVIGVDPPAEQRVALRRLMAYLKRQPMLRLRHAAIAQTTAKSLESTAAPMTADAYTQFAELFERSNLGRDVREQFDAGARRSRLVGSTIKLQGKQADDAPLDAKRLQGKVVLIDFWATWCRPCLQEQPALLRLHEMYSKQGLEVVGVSMDEDRDDLRQFLRARPLPWPNLFDRRTERGRHPLAVEWGIQTIPAMVLLDRDGKVVAFARDSKSLQPHLKRLLEP